MKSPTIRSVFCFIIAFVSSATASAQTDSARANIERIIAHASGRVGVAIMGIESFDTLTVNGNDHFPMQSVFKFPLALAVLSQVDKGALSLDQQIHLTKNDLPPNTWSPLREKYPDGEVDVTLDELLAATVSESDNNGCDILFRLMGGPGIVDRYVHGLRIMDMAIVATEGEMRTAWEVQYRNWSSPLAMAQLLHKFYYGSVLSQRSREYLWQLMAKTTTAPKRLKGQLPAGTIVAHKTGSSGTDDRGIAAATNDVGIVTLPNDKHLIIAVFVSDSGSGESARDEVIANIAGIAWSTFSVH